MSDRDWTALELIRWTANYFREHEIPSARLDAELLLGHVLELARIELYTGFDRPVGAEERSRFRELVRRRAKERVPVAYLTGVREFWSLPFRVTADVLIPRPETEVLVQAAVQLAPRRILELGTGSGVIAAALARELPEAEITALERSAKALEVARLNLDHLGLAERVRLVLGDGIGAAGDRYNLVVSNPPYVPTAELAGLAPELSHEPREALDGGPDGLEVIRLLIKDAPSRLLDSGSLALEVGAGQSGEVEALLRDAGAETVERVPDLSGIERVVVARFAAGTASA